MRPKLFLIIFLLTSVWALGSRPNVVFVMTDDQGYGDLACTGNPILQTPFLDALHNESVRFTDYHVSPTCAPTRGALMSGHYTNRAGPWHTIMGRSFLRPEALTFGQVFADNGYSTGMFGKWHLGDNYPYRPEDRGFQEVVYHGGGGVGQTPDYWDNSYFDDTYIHNGKSQKYQGYCTDVYFQEATRFIGESISQEKPFMAYIVTNAPHSPFHSPDKYWKPYTGKGISDEEAIFFGMIANTDENVGQLRAYLEEKGVSDNTIFIFTTDNGTATGQNIYNAGMRGRKASEYDGGHRVPFFLHWPEGKLAEARDIDQLTAHIDVLPTLIELCGLNYPLDYSFDGRSLAPLLYKNPTPWPDRTIITDSQRVRDPIKWRMSSTMTGQWRLINGTELYDIKKDRGQETDVSSRYPEVVKRLRSDYEKWWASISPGFEKETRIVVGNSAENPALLTGHDWITNDELTPWHQAYIRGGKPGTGTWYLEVDQAGRYEINLTRWPPSLGLSLQSDLSPGKPVPGLTAFREEPGKAIAIHSAILETNKDRHELKIDSGSHAARFVLDLDKGPVDLTGTFLHGPDSTPLGAYYATVRRL
ncbi:MAG: arylsulfatase [Verrucomicrobia bacterium]|nr:arylsulfatase [Verrucomicrobiota bacterium]